MHTWKGLSQIRSTAGVCSGACVSLWGIIPISCTSAAHWSETEDKPKDTDGLKSGLKATWIQSQMTTDLALDLVEVEGFDRTFAGSELILGQMISHLPRRLQVSAKDQRMPIPV